MQDDVLLAVNNLTVRFDVSAPALKRLITRSPRRFVHAVEDVSFTVPRRSVFALVGESGCGKSTLARAVVGVERPTSGHVSLAGRRVSGFTTRAAERTWRSDVQMIFQDPQSSLNPRWRVGRSVAEPLRTHRMVAGRAEAVERVGALLEAVGLSSEDARRFPHQFSGGQRQRIAIARALSTRPALVVCDEPTSALDVSVQAQILNLMRRLQREFGLTYLLITHNFAVVAHMADHVGVMYLGRLVEQGPADVLLADPKHPYTRLLLDTVPDPARRGRAREPMKGEAPSPINPPVGCAFQQRCPLATARCAHERPVLRSAGRTAVACHAFEERRLPPWRTSIQPDLQSAEGSR
ncbi:MAG: ATP-binding cassette domain-containing protein [Rhodobacteraceae bacterium]|nr:MAG: ATP-binding cassette domain-containing protein [Paracoccaceae bacterium]